MKKDIYAKICGFKWFKNGKEYECPLCGSKYISLIAVNESPKPSGQMETEQRGDMVGGCDQALREYVDAEMWV